MQFIKTIGGITLLMETLITLFWTSGDVSSGGQSPSRSLPLHALSPDLSTDSSDSPLV